MARSEAMYRECEVIFQGNDTRLLRVPRNALKVDRHEQQTVDRTASLIMREHAAPYRHDNAADVAVVTGISSRATQ
ncbi:hypothetical protein H3V53_05005 [Paraburkholderia bengalensis]|uniref:Uncharacterized protein n=1 Tax=Paraburkholderia bengalensis TaxID=2747562 RepID=A0ABU8IM62_9BURK